MRPTREPVVAGRFYPADKRELLTTVERYMEEVVPQPPLKAIAVIAPHAGYVYSGQLAAKTLHSVVIPKTVLLIGPNHTGQGAQASLSARDWSTPFGHVKSNQKLTDHILSNSTSVIVDDNAHMSEHSLEVQLPFLQYLQPQLSITPLTLKSMSYEQCEGLAKSLFQGIKEYCEPVLIVASTDMSHYEPRAKSEVKDAMALAAIKELDPLQLYTTVQTNNISMCGVIPVVITLLVSQKLGADSVRMAGYMDSGAVSGDLKQVVGYAGVIIE
ncbi:AmmeMemoRadiSam system protein B [Desulforhopalus sp. 52FAK]